MLRLKPFPSGAITILYTLCFLRGGRGHSTQRKQLATITANNGSALFKYADDFVRAEQSAQYLEIKEAGWKEKVAANEFSLMRLVL